MFRMARFFLLSLSLVAFGVFATSCGEDHSQVRFVHASPGTADTDPPSLDILVDGKAQATGLTFLGLAPTTGYGTVTAGNRRAEARITGATTDVINSIVSFASKKAYTVLLVGKTDPAPGDIAFLQKTDDNSAPASGRVKLRVIHAAPDGPGLLAGHLDIYIVPPGTDITNMTPTISALPYQQASNYQSAAAGPIEVIVTATGDPDKIRLIDDPNFVLTAGQIRTLVTVDDSAGDKMSDTLLVLSDLN